MNKNIGKFLRMFIPVILIVVILIILYLYLGQGRKEIKIAGNFIEKLEKENIIIQNSNKIKFKLVEKVHAKDREEIYSLTGENYRLEIDKKGDIISFIDKEDKIGNIYISIDEGIKKAKEFLFKITGKAYNIKDIVEKNAPYYSIIFEKSEEGYPYYSEEVIININKVTGKLQGYLNNTNNYKHKPIEINYTEKDAKETALKVFNEVNKNGNLNGEITLAFCNNKSGDESPELCYVVNITNKKESTIYFISTSTGNAINSFSNVIEKTEVK